MSEDEVEFLHIFFLTKQTKPIQRNMNLNKNSLQSIFRHLGALNLQSDLLSSQIIYTRILWPRKFIQPRDIIMFITITFTPLLLLPLLDELAQKKEKICWLMVSYFKNKINKIGYLTIKNLTVMQDEIFVFYEVICKE